MTWATPQLAALVAAVAIPALVILYFLKLRRIPREVSTTLLWKKSIQDIQANAPFQKLRKNLLLLLQLLILALILLALAQPRSVAGAGAGEKLVILVDRSASMQSLDAPGAASRLEHAKARAIELVESLRAPSLIGDTDQADEAMVVAFGAGAELRTAMTSDRAALIRAIESIEPADTTSSIEQAFRLATARPGEQPLPSQAGTPSDTNEPGTSETGADEPNAPERTPLRFHLFSDGNIPDLDALAADPTSRIAPTFEYHAQGDPDSVNIGIVSLQSERDYDDPTKLSVFVGVQSTDTRARTVDAELLVDGAVRAVRAVECPPSTRSTPDAPREPSVSGVVFELTEPDAATITVRLATGHDRDPGADALGADNQGTLMVAPAARARVALVSSGSLFLRNALEGLSIAHLDTLSPAQYRERHARDELDSYDLIILDRVLPQRAQGPELFDPGRYLVLGAVPDSETLLIDKGTGPATQIINWRRAHPLLRPLTLDAITIAESRTVELPDNSDFVSIAETTEGPAILELSSGRVRAVVVTFDPAQSNWPLDVSFVVFLGSAVDYLASTGASSEDNTSALLTPGRVLADRIPMDAADLRLRRPDGVTETDLVPAPDGRVVYGPIERAGLYELSWRGSPAPGDTVTDNRVTRRYSANLLSADESDIATQPELALSDRVVAAQTGTIERLKEWWPVLLLLALLVMLAEWWVYNKRVYL